MASLIQQFRKPFDSDQRITIIIRKWDKEGLKTINDASFSIKTTSSFRSIFSIFALRETPYSDCLGYFKFMYGDQLISGDDTPNTLQFSDGDCIDAIPCGDEDVLGSSFV